MTGVSHEADIFQPRSVITVDDVTELNDFETLVGDTIIPNMTPTDRIAWLGRSALKDLLRPAGFNGRMMNMQLYVMEDPLSQLLTVHERGLKGVRRSGQRSTELGREAMKLEYRADAKSTGKKALHPVTAELYYFPLARTGASTDEYNVRQVNNNGGSPIIRSTTKPVFDALAFERMHDESVQVGLGVIRERMAHAHVQPKRT